MHNRSRAKQGFACFVNGKLKVETWLLLKMGSRENVMSGIFWFKDLIGLMNWKASSVTLVWVCLGYV